MKNRTNWLLVAYGITIIAVQTAYLFRILPANASPDTQNEAVEASNCVEVESGHYDCSDPATRAKWMKYQDELIKEYEAKIQDLEGFDVIRTRYSRADSCHNPRGKECLTAIGRDTKAGVTVACPYFLALGTKIQLSDDPTVYVCHDRYSKRLDNERGLPTIDVFAEADGLGALPSFKKVKVRIIK